mmetsp:Transcript_12103/g.18023  ORF Transcript_12103/g.18023 Transcript_12103/m.18023 type:complete len:296 (-) Transcript_12103:1375-2262(-)
MFSRRRNSEETAQLLLNNEEYDDGESMELESPDHSNQGKQIELGTTGKTEFGGGEDKPKPTKKYNHPWYRQVIDFFLKQDSRRLTKHDKLKRLPPRKMRYSSWKYEVLRPWEPQPPKNYYELLHKTNPWYDKPPSSQRRLMFLAIFTIFCFFCCFIPFLLNQTAFNHRLTVVKLPQWFLPWWANIVIAIFTHATNSIGIWFVYLTGGFLKHWKVMLPFFFMMACESIWPDFLFSARHIGLATIICGVGWCFATLTIILFFFVMEYAGFCIIFYWIFVTYEMVVLVWIWVLNGEAY